MWKEENERVDFGVWKVLVKKIESIVIYVLNLFSFDSTKVVPWNYESIVYVGNKHVILKEPVVTNIVGASGVTLSGRVFAPKVIPWKSSVPIVEPIKGKEVNSPETGEGSSKKVVSVEEDREFLKIIKKSNYKVVDQLNQTPSKISIISLLMSFEAYRIALLELLNEAYMEKDIIVNQFDDMIANLSVSSCLIFTDDELPLNGWEHNMVLHISI